MLASASPSGWMGPRKEYSRDGLCCRDVHGLKNAGQAWPKLKLGMASLAQNQPVQPGLTRPSTYGIDCYVQTMSIKLHWLEGKKLLQIRLIVIAYIVLISYAYDCMKCRHTFFVCCRPPKYDLAWPSLARAKIWPGLARSPILISHLYSVDCVAVTDESKSALFHCVGDVQ